jgi:hypothetical protein
MSYTNVLKIIILLVAVINFIICNEAAPLNVTGRLVKYHDETFTNFTDLGVVVDMYIGVQGQLYTQCCLAGFCVNVESVSNIIEPSFGTFVSTSYDNPEVGGYEPLVNGIAQNPFIVGFFIPGTYAYNVAGVCPLTQLPFDFDAQINVWSVVTSIPFTMTIPPGAGRLKYPGDWSSMTLSYTDTFNNPLSTNVIATNTIGYPVTIGYMNIIKSTQRYFIDSNGNQINTAYTATPVFDVFEAGRVVEPYQDFPIGQSYAIDFEDGPEGRITNCSLVNTGGVESHVQAFSMEDSFQLYLMIKVHSTDPLDVPYWVPLQTLIWRVAGKVIDQGDNDYEVTYNDPEWHPADVTGLPTWSGTSLSVIKARPQIEDHYCYVPV